VSNDATPERVETVRGLDVARLAARWALEPRPRVVLALLLAFAIRAPLVLPSLPYLGYIDEGHVLHPVVTLLRTGGWDPAWYLHPSLTIYLITLVVHAIRPVYFLVHGHTLLQDLPSGSTPYYDVVSPPEVILAGRLVVLAASLGIVAVGMALARRLGGRRAALASGIVLALCPALLQRSAIVIVDTVATFFVLATLLYAHRLQNAGKAVRSASAGRDALIAGLLSGASAASKYPAGLVVLAVLLALLGSRTEWRERGRLLLIALGGAFAGAAAGTPAFVLRPRAILDALREQSRLYATPSLFSAGGGGSGLFRQALLPEELGIAACVLGLAGLAALFSRRETRSTALAWSTFAAAFLAPVILHSYQPFRYGLPLVPPLLITAAILLFPPAASSGRAVFGVVAFLVVIVSFVPGWRWTYRERGVKDSRTTFVDWLAVTAKPGLRILVVQELAFLPKELARVPAAVVVAPWSEAKALVERRTFDAIVYGKFDLAGALPSLPVPAGELSAFETWLGTLRVEARFGSVPTPVYAGFWRTNRELILVAIGSQSGQLIRGDSVR
jgi:hypothetical protein